MRIYIACGLTHVPRELFSEYTSFIHNLASSLSKDATNHEVKYALVNSDPQLADKPYVERARLCYIWDKNMVAEADLVIAEASFPSTGLGIELQIAESNDIPILICYRDFKDNKAEPICYENPDKSTHLLQIGEGFVSLMALGLPAVYKIVRYFNCNDGIEAIRNIVELLNDKQVSN